MTISRFFLLFTLSLFLLIGVASWKKRGQLPPRIVENVRPEEHPSPIEVHLEEEIALVESSPPPKNFLADPAPAYQIASSSERQPSQPRTHPLPAQNLPEADRIEEFFRTKGTKFPIVQTLAYRSRVDWLKGRPAWLTDYSGHYKTSRHFIARSLHGRPEYFKQDLSEGDYFNVLHPQKELQFYLLIDVSRCKMWFYYLDRDEKEPVLVKTYDVGLGRPEPSQTSGLLTPLGKFILGDKIVVYKPGMMGHYQGKKIQMMNIFGTRWIPFEKEISGGPAKGLGVHGSPWIETEAGELVCDESGIKKYESDGCIRLRTADMEELFAIIISRPTTVEIVRDFQEATFTP